MIQFSSFSRLLKASAVSVFCLGMGGAVQAQMTVTANQTATTMAQYLTGPGVIVLNPTLSCPNNGSGTFVIGPGPGNLGIDSGLILTSGRAFGAGTNYGANSLPPTNFATTSAGGSGDADLTNISGQTTDDACILEFDFVPAGDTIKFDYVFASEEYNGPHGNFNCSIFDVFAFFISGPGITGSQNIALIPGTTIPVGVSTVNDGVGASPGNSCYTNTNNNGPYSTYYNLNTANPPVVSVYTGFTDVFQAIKPVVACDTYHLKIAIADASDDVYDSGVFLKAGSLTSNAINITPVGGGGLAAPNPYCVRNCLPGQFVFSRPVSRPTPLTIKYLIGGSAVNGVDYNTITDSVIIPANQTQAVLNIQAVAPPTGTDSVVLKILSPYTCNGNPIVIDSATMLIFDSLVVDIANPDTAICEGQCVQLTLVPYPTNNLMTFNWLPTSGLNVTTGDTVTACPPATTTYQVEANLPGAGCPPSYSEVTVTIVYGPDVDAGRDTTTCVGSPYTFPTTVTPTNQVYTWNWTPATGLNASNIKNPTALATTAGTTTYIVAANPGAAGCIGRDTVVLRVLPGDFTLITQDTAICKGASVAIRATGHPAYNYSWAPTAGVNLPFTLTPVITPDTTRTYTVKASFPGCSDITKSLVIDVQPNPVVNIGPDRDKCQWDTLQFHGIVSPSWYTQYAYSWSPAADVDSATAQSVVFFGQQDATLVLTVTTPAGCTGQDQAQVTVRQGNFAELTPVDTAICPNDSIQFVVSGTGTIFNWTPGIYLSDSTSANPVQRGITDAEYVVLVTDQYGCYDTLQARVIVHPAAVLELGEDVTLFPGESHLMNPAGNCYYFAWTPPLGLSNANIANPTAMPPVNTRYYVAARTEWGCEATDSIDVLVNAESVIAVPNAFTPGSYPNGEIKVERRGLATLQAFRIYNRWGTKVFETADINQGWDGRFNGEPQPMGVYVYIVEATLPNGRRVTKNGNITLLR